MSEDPHDPVEGDLVDEGSVKDEPVDESSAEPVGRVFARTVARLHATTIDSATNKPFKPEVIVERIDGWAAELPDERSTMSVGYYYNLLNGSRRNPTINSVDALAWFFGVPPDELVRRRSEEEDRAFWLARSLQSNRLVADIAFRARVLSQRELQLVLGLVDELARHATGLEEQASGRHQTGSPDDSR